MQLKFCQSCESEPAKNTERLGFQVGFYICDACRVQGLERKAALLDEVVDALRGLMLAVAPELAGTPKNVMNSYWAAQWDEAETVLKKAEALKGE